MSVESSTIEAPTRIKAILLGDQAVGKSAIIERFVHNKYEEANYVTYSSPSLLSESTSS